jgi:hypothetical protein
LLSDEELSPSVFVPVVAEGGRNHTVAAQVQKGGGVVTCAGINYLAIVIAAVVAFAASAAWYMSLSRSYAAALGKTADQIAEERKKPGAFLPYIYALIGNIIIGWTCSGISAPDRTGNFPQWRCLGGFHLVRL